MRLMTYNILNGGNERLDNIIGVIKEQNPDFLVINEANGFEQNNNEKLQLISAKTKLPYYHISLSGKEDYHTAIFSRYPLTSTNISPLMRAGILSVVDTPVGKLHIIGVHLAPTSEEVRQPEVQRLIELINSSEENMIIMGDLNSLSPKDGYSEHLPDQFNEKQKQKFTRDNKLSFDTIAILLNSGFIDIATTFHANAEHTVPTLITQDTSHLKARLDYIFIKGPISKKVQKYTVIKNDQTHIASDHYPVVIEIM